MDDKSRRWWIAEWEKEREGALNLMLAGLGPADFDVARARFDRAVAELKKLGQCAC